MKSEFKALDALIDHLRSKGVAAFKGLHSGELIELAAYKADGIELVLLEHEPAKPEKERKKSVDEILEPKRKGADGQTAEQQEALYGVVIDAEE